MRIAMISEHASPLVARDGQGAYVAQVARALTDDGHAVDIFTRRHAPEQPAVVYLAPRLRVLHVPAGPPEPLPAEAMLPYMPDFAAACIRLCDAGLHYDVVHANFFMSGWVALQLKQRLGVPFVMTFHSLGRAPHGGEAPGFPSERATIEQTLVQRADAIVAECPEAQADLLHLYGADCSRLALVPSGFDADLFMPMNRAQARAELELDPKAFIALHVGGRDTGLGTTLRALASLPADCRLVALLDDDTKAVDQARAEADSLGIADRVQFVATPAHDALRAWYAAAQVLVHLPPTPRGSTTALEAMACGTPVIASRTGALAYVVVEGATGHLVAPDDADTLADRVRALHAQPAMQHTLGIAAARRARAMFSWHHVAHQLVTTYQSLPEPVPDAPTRPAVPGIPAALVAAE